VVTVGKKKTLVLIIRESSKKIKTAALSWLRPEILIMSPTG
jgi:hypothetical protein